MSNPSYIQSRIDAPIGDKATEALLVRNDGRALTSAMLGELNGRALATLDQIFDVALAMLANDGTITIKFPTIGALS